MIDYPDNFKCPITLSKLINPVTMKCGHNFEKESLFKWVKDSRTNCPCCNLSLVHKINNKDKNKYKSKNNYKINDLVVKVVDNKFLKTFINCYDQLILDVSTLLINSNIKEESIFNFINTITKTISNDFNNNYSHKNSDVLIKNTVINWLKIINNFFNVFVFESTIKMNDFNQLINIDRYVNFFVNSSDVNTKIMLTINNPKLDDECSYLSQDLSVYMQMLSFSCLFPWSNYRHQRSQMTTSEIIQNEGGAESSSITPGINLHQ